METSGASHHISVRDTGEAVRTRIDAARGVLLPIDCY